MNRAVVWVTIHRPSGRAIVTGKDAERFAWEANPQTTWNHDWCGWTLDNLNQVSDICSLASIYDAIYREADWTPELLKKRQAARRKAAHRPRVKKAA